MKDVKMIQDFFQYVGQKSKNMFLLTLSLILVACASSPPPTKVSYNPKTLPKLPSQQTSSVDGIQDVVWQITLINRTKAKFFYDQPVLKLNSRIKTISGNTGCNPIFGKYQLNLANQRIEFDVKAGHQSCQGALAQEADLMDALQRVERLQFHGNTMDLLDGHGQRLIQLQKK